jgi:hypothetical protein
VSYIIAPVSAMVAKNTNSVIGWWRKTTSRVRPIRFNVGLPALATLFAHPLGIKTVFPTKSIQEKTDFRWFLREKQWTEVPRIATKGGRHSVFLPVSPLTGPAPAGLFFCRRKPAGFEDLCQPACSHAASAPTALSSAAFRPVPPNHLPGTINADHWAAMQSFEPRMVCNATLSLVAEQRPTSWCTIGAAQKKADQMRMFRVIAVCFLAAPIGAQAQGVPRGMNYGAHRGAYTGYSVLGPVGGFVGGVVGGAAGGVVGGVNGVFGINPHPHRYYRRYRR